MTLDRRHDPYIMYRITAMLVVTCLWYYFVDFLFWSTIVGYSVYTAIVYFSRKDALKICPTGKAVLITGCDTGFGNDLAKRAHALGFTVFAGCLGDSEGSRELDEYGERMHVIRLDVTREDEVEKALRYVQDKCGNTGLFALVNNAGIDASGPVELCSMKFYQDVCDVNLFGPIRMTKAFLPLIRQAKGRIINMSSERGLLARAGESVYCISKYGLEAFSDALRNEVKSFGVQVSLIEPGHFGGATAILKTHCRSMLRERLLEGFNRASEDVKRIYPREVIDNIVEGRSNAISSSYPSTEPVIDVLERQLTHLNIKSRYLIGGTKSFVDLRVVYIALKSFLPDVVMDYLTTSDHV